MAAAAATAAVSLRPAIDTRVGNNYNNNDHCGSIVRDDVPWRITCGHVPVVPVRVFCFWRGGDFFVFASPKKNSDARPAQLSRRNGTHRSAFLPKTDKIITIILHYTIVQRQTTVKHARYSALASVTTERGRRRRWRRWRDESPEKSRREAGPRHRSKTGCTVKVHNVITIIIIIIEVVPPPHHLLSTAGLLGPTVRSVHERGTTLDA